MYGSLFWISFCFGIAAVAVLLRLRVRLGGVAALCAKTIASLCFVSMAFAASNANPAKLPFNSWMTFGLILGMLGDIWLGLKWVYQQDKDFYLYAGFAAFLAGHICFCAAIFTNSPKWTAPLILLAVALALAVSAVNLLLEKPLKLQYGTFRWIVFLYGAVLFFTLASAVIAALRSGFGKVWVVMSVGAFLFTASDLVLSLLYFGKRKTSKGIAALNLALYYAAQFAMAGTILYIE